jgi:sugar phosphate permease
MEMMMETMTATASAVSVAMETGLLVETLMAVGVLTVMAAVTAMAAWCLLRGSARGAGAPPAPGRRSRWTAASVTEGGPEAAWGRLRGASPRRAPSMG